jgi:hypothetical protein
LHWIEAELLTKEENLIGLMALNRETLGQAECFDSPDPVVLDMDSSESLVHGVQEGSPYNAHLESVCYHLRLQNLGADGGGPEPCLRNRFRGSK